ncbi:MAG: hypothetical protein M0P74_09605 [Syntrophales bacterium]|jgi:hypothetical protein|nr:hypothetical protein [Syntrophales bacterium]
MVRPLAGDIEGQRTSGMTIDAYCRENQIPTTSFYNIRRRLKEREAVTGGFPELKTARLVAPASVGIHIRFGNNLYDEVERGLAMFGLTAALFMSLVKS